MLHQNKIVFTIISCLFFTLFTGSIQAQKITKKVTSKTVIDTAKNKAIVSDTIKPRIKLKAFKSKAHASYYANKFNGKRTSSGIRFSNDKYTAAHRKLPFGTKLKVTNEENGKWVIVEVIDRGPFSRGREIDLSKRAFMEIASNKNSGSTIVKLEIIEN
jgi:rare lipoprotein A